VSASTLDVNIPEKNINPGTTAYLNTFFIVISIIYIFKKYFYATILIVIDCTVILNDAIGLKF